MKFKEMVKTVSSTYFSSDICRAKNIDRPLVVLKNEILECLFDFYLIFLNNKLNKAAYDTKNIIDSIITVDSQEDCYEYFKTFYESTLLPISTTMFINGVSDYTYFEYNGITYSCSDSDIFASIFKDVKTNKKRVNVLIEDLNLKAPAEFNNINLKSVWDNSNSELVSYYYSPYANDLISYEIKMTEKITDHFMFGDSANLRFDTEFDVGILNALNYNITAEEFKSNFYHVNSHIRPGALFIAILNSAALTYENLEFLSMYLKDVNVYISENEKLIFIVGIATKSRKRSFEIVSSIIARIVGIRDNEFEYNLISEDKYDITFRSAYLSVSAALKMINDNTDKVNTINKNVFEKLSENLKEDNRSPLIPFNAGQLGLVLVSGDIDGVIDEGNGFYHAIKGSTYRRYENVESGEQNTICQINTVATRVTALLPNGTILKLA